MSFGPCSLLHEISFFYSTFCSIAVITEGKYAELKCQSHLQLMQLMEDANSEARLNAIKALGLIAETPQGKEELKPALEKVFELGIEL